MSKTKARSKSYSAAEGSAVTKVKKNQNTLYYQLFETTFAQWFWTLGFIIGGCCSNAYALELIVNEVPSSGNLITFAQFSFMATEGLLRNLEFSKGSGLPRLKKRVIPFSRWMLMVLLFCSSSMLNNIAFKYKIPVPLHIIFRSGSLFASLILGWLLLGKRYSVGQIISVVMISIGIIITTLSTVKPKEDTHTSSLSEEVIGVTILSVALFIAALLGVVQEITYQKYEKAWKEGLFYTHALSLPMFLLFMDDLKKQTQLYVQSDTIGLQGLVGTFLDMTLLSKFPKLILYLMLNVGTQYFCVSGVQRLSSMASALTLNLVLTIRKMLSIVFSVLYFKQPITVSFLIGSALAFGGTFLYTSSSSKTPLKRPSTPKSRAKKSK